MIFSTSTTLALLIQYKYALIIPIAILEGPIISVIAGLLASQGYLNLSLVIVLLIICDLIGDVLYYSLGRFGGHLFIRKWGKLFRINDATVIKLENTFHNYSFRLLAFGKTQSFGSAILFAAGVAKMPFWKYLWYNLLSTIVKSTGLVLLGYYFGRAYEKIDNYITKVGLVSLFVVIVILILRFIYKKKKI